jgi:hypothetical protein
MKYKFILLLVFVIGIFINNTVYSDDCPKNPPNLAMCSLEACQCTNQPTSLFVADSFTVDGSCCRFTCITDASFVGNNCICNTNFYKEHDKLCTACSSGYSSSAGSTAQSDCKKTCSPITVTKGVAFYMIFSSGSLGFWKFFTIFATVFRSK